MKIKKMYQGNLPENTVVNTQSDSQINAYSCEYANEHFGGVVLYDNTSGASNNITLRDNVANYNFVEIFYRDVDQHYSSTKIYSPNGKKIMLTGCYIDDGNNFIHKINLKLISGTSITEVISGEGNIKNNAVYFNTQNTTMYITKVVGYK